MEGRNSPRAPLYRGTPTALSLGAVIAAPHSVVKRGWQTVILAICLTLLALATTGCGNHQEVNVKQETTAQTIEREQVKERLDGFEKRIAGLEQGLKQSLETNNQILDQLKKAQAAKQPADSAKTEAENVGTSESEDNDEPENVVEPQKVRKTTSTTRHIQRRRHHFYRPPQQCVCRN